jgi:hypothetical protein
MQQARARDPFNTQYTRGAGYLQKEDDSFMFESLHSPFEAVLGTATPDPDPDPNPDPNLNSPSVHEKISLKKRGRFFGQFSDQLHST